uniref:Uncharacterized protein n=1 Tax=Anguilla anguilla TaxID=7936 RepID=A0A0E9W9F9_ANGAN
MVTLIFKQIVTVPLSTLHNSPQGSKYVPVIMRH